MKKITCLLLAILTVVILCACGSVRSETAGDGDAPKNAGEPASPADFSKDIAPSVEYDRRELSGAEEGLYIEKAADGEADAFYDGAVPGAIGDDGGVAIIDDPIAPEPIDGGEPVDPEPIDGGEPGETDPTVTVRIEAGTLTAGEWKDNDNYDFWQKVLAREEWQKLAELWKMNVTGRFAVTVSDGQNVAKNAAVELLDADGNVISRAVTDSYGKAYLYYNIDSSGKTPAKVSVAGQTRDVTAEELAAGGATVAGSGARYTKLDLMFTTDTTGSMTDELAYLKKELGNVIERVAEENTGLDIRLSVNFYRDEGDEYVVRDFAFSGNIDEVLRQLDMQFSDGGGDYPEAVHTALDNSINGHEWREDAVKLVFLTLDAPGHSDAAGVPESVRASVVTAAAKGIRIIPIAASGVDTETEFMLRAMACATGGTYIFLTDHSGVGESHLEPTIGDYNVKKLNDLLVKVINEYCK